MLGPIDVSKPECHSNRVSTSSGNHGKPGKSQKICMEKSWNLKTT